MRTPSRPSSPHRAASGRGVVVALAVLLVAVAGACSGDDDGTALRTGAAGSVPGRAEGRSAADTVAPTTSTAPPSSTTTTAVPAPDPGDPEAAAYVDALVAEFEDDGPLGAVDLRCLASRFVADIGVDRLRETGVTPEQLAEQGPHRAGIDRATAEAMLTSFERCGLPMAEMYEQFAIGEAPDVLTCMREVVPEAELREVMTESLRTGDDSAFDDLDRRWEACA